MRIIENNKEKELKDNIIINKKRDIKIKLEIYEYLISIKEMFKECEAIIKIKKFKTIFVTNISNLFFGCSSLSSLPDISK